MMRVSSLSHAVIDEMTALTESISAVVAHDRFTATKTMQECASLLRQQQRTFLASMTLLWLLDREDNLHIVRR